MIRLIVLISILALSPILKIGAQQLSQYSQYRYSLFVINPAYAGNKDQIQGLLSERRQWLGIDGSPHSQALNLHAPIKNRKMGIGLSIFNESIGAHGTTSAFAAYSYSIRTPKSSLSFGLRAGFYSFRVNGSTVSYRDQSDPSALTNLQSNFLPTFDFGMHFYQGNFMTGLSVSNLTETEIDFSADNIVKTSLKRHIFAYAGYVFRLSDKWQFQPTVLGKFTPNAPFNFDLNTSFIYNSRLGLGLSWRSNNAFVAMVQVWFAKNFRLGYSYDYEMKLSSNTNISGSHELFVGFDFNRKNSAVVNPRFL